MQNYRSKSDSTIIGSFQFFSQFQSSHFGFLIFFAVLSGFFRCFVGFFSPFQHRQTRAKTKKIQNLPTGRETCNSWKKINLIISYIGIWRCRYYYTVYIYIYTQLQWPTMVMAPSGIAYRGFKIQECGGRDPRMLAFARPIEEIVPIHCDDVTINHDLQYQQIRGLFHCDVCKCLLFIYCSCDW